MSISEIAVLLVITLGSVWFSRTLWRMGARGWQYAVAWSVRFLGLVLVTTMAAHLLEVMSRILVGLSFQGSPFPYDFRAYSLLLLGAVMVAVGAYLIHVAGVIGRGDNRARRDALRGVLVVLLLVVPLIPIQAFFAVPLSIIGGISLGLTLASVRRQSPQAPRTSPA